jgi:hypothetical protein
VSAEMVSLQVASKNLCGVLGLACYETCGVFRDIAHAITGELPYIQHRHFGPVIAVARCNMFGTDNKAEWDTNTT